MAPPPIQVFLTSIASQPALRHRQEYILRILQVKKIPYTSYDLASDEAAKRLWKRKAPADKQQLPGILVGDEFPGTFQDFEQAVEFGEVEVYLRRNEDYKPFADDLAPLPQQAIAVPGGLTPEQTTPERLKPHLRAVAAAAASAASSKGGSSAVPTPVNKREAEAELDVGALLPGYGLQGVRITQEELRQLLEELGLDGDAGGEAAASAATAATATVPAGEPVKGLPSGGGEAPLAQDDVATASTTSAAVETEASIAGDGDGQDAVTKRE